MSIHHRYGTLFSSTFSLLWYITAKPVSQERFSLILLQVQKMTEPNDNNQCVKIEHAM